MADEPEEAEAVPQEFWDVADQFINLANELAQTWPTHRVSAAMMYAAARYNAFNACALDAEAEQNKDAIVEYFCKEYRSMFVDNLDQTITRINKE